MAFEEAVNGTDGWQVVAVLLPVAVEDLQRCVRVLLDFQEDPFAGFLVDGATLAGVGAGVLAGETGVTAFGVVIPRKTVLEVWADVWSIVAEESAKLMSPDKHRVLIHRCESQLAVPLATVATPA